LTDWGYISSNTSIFMSFVDAFVYGGHVVALEIQKRESLQELRHQIALNIVDFHVA